MACANKECHLWDQCQATNCIAEDEYDVLVYDSCDFKDGYP